MTANDIVVTRAGVTVHTEGDATRRDVASIQKSIVSLLVGIAVEQGALTLDDTVAQHLGDTWTASDSVTVRHLLSMTSGLGPALEFVADPGKRWDYNLTVYPTTKRVLRAALGRSLDDVTAEWITGPLGMTESSWENRVWDGTLPDGWKPAFVYPDGTPMEAFVSTARDLAIFGNAVMNGCVGLGLDEGYRVAMTQPSQTLNPAYGLLWWVRPDGYAALGNGSQCCVVIPDRELVVARTGDEPGAGGDYVNELVAQAIAAHQP